MNSVRYQRDYERRLTAVMIGCGGHAFRNILPTFHYAPVNLTAVCDKDAERAKSAAREWGAEKFYTSYRDMLKAEQPEVVFVVLNPDSQGRPQYPTIAKDALRAGASVWIEKPPAASSAEIRQMMEVSRETQKFVGVGFKKMFFPANVKAKEIISRPEFGAVTTITARYPQSLPPTEHLGDDRRMAGFLDHVAHPYSLLRFLGGAIESLCIEREARVGASLTTIRFKSGALGSLHLSAGQPGQAPLERTEVIGEGASVVVDNNIRVTYYRLGAPNGEYGRTGSFFGSDEGAALFWEPEFSLGQLYNKGLFLLGYVSEILYFCECALASRPPEIGSLADALEIMNVYEAYRQPPGQRRQIAE